MDNLKSIIRYNTNRTLNQKEIKEILINLSALKGITSINIEPDYIFIEYDQHLQSQISLKDSLVQAGFPFRPQNKNPGLLKKFITKLGNENKKSFGNKRMGCCDLEH